MVQIGNLCRAIFSDADLKMIHQNGFDKASIWLGAKGKAPCPRAGICAPKAHSNGLMDKQREPMDSDGTLDEMSFNRMASGETIGGELEDHMVPGNPKVVPSGTVVRFMVSVNTTIEHC
ncbi:hypothetical protein B9Z55_018295 [Caenorhabditis nigoni]|uniref:Uncharacterized protein n=1 Tax=Caenorhabditis nigoni TaxID=1611254 RepID=A0A2G5TDG5_9PELO|nr:hypothetical protein B9Z55_018295 [Caenorhabditis nigoni]